MNIIDVIDIFELISRGTENLPSRSIMLTRRKKILSELKHPTLIKNAFDTRRINQEEEVNPRRGLQNYNRSESFISQAMEEKLKSLARLKKVLGSLKEIYGKEPEWQDSNARILLSNVDKCLRTNINDRDFTDTQPGVGSVDYLEELLHVRYRLAMSELSKIAEQELKDAILSKDEDLTHKDLNNSLEITKADIGKHGYDTLLEKLFDGVRATKDNPEVERTITITIKDSIKK
jgi:hypothetical protein